jgi:uncharacterized protein DUF6851
LVLALILTCSPSEQSAQVKRVVDDGVPVPRAESQDSMAPDVRRIRNPGLSVARLWDEQLLDAIRIDIPKPPAHARNLFHLSVAMWDAWAAYAPAAVGYVVKEKHTAMDIEAARAEAISYASYRLLKYRFPVGYLDIDGKPCHPNAAISQAEFDDQMDALGYDTTFISTDGNSAAALGNRIAATLIAYGQSDGSNEGVGCCYPDDTGYFPINPEQIFKLPGAGTVIDPNRWQPLAFDFFVTQNGIPIGQSIQRFVGVGWADVRPFALRPEDVNPETGLPLDPGPPPQLRYAGDSVVKDAMVELIRLSSRIDTSQNQIIDISPGAMLNNPLGSDNGAGYPKNPVTNRPYEPNLVNRADFQRVVTEFWADGPRSETPPGHWNVIANSISDHPSMRQNKRIGGKGRIVNDLEWDVKVYLALNGAVHDAAIWAWGNKNVYDSSRPITLIRYMAGLGQSSDPSGPSYHPDGLTLVPDLIEVITPETTAPGGKHANLVGFEGQIAIRAWLGGPVDPATQVSGVGWKRGVQWITYMPKNFVTPPFPGYTSGHSTFSRSAAEVLAAITGTPFFPGGLGTFTATQDEYLTIENGPSQSIELQWATYFDAADQAGISRRFGGIHPYYDDYPSRITGSRIGRNAWAKAQELYGPRTVTLCHVSPGNPAGDRTLVVDAAAAAAHLAHGDQLGACRVDDRAPASRLTWIPSP